MLTTCTDSIPLTFRSLIWQTIAIVLFTGKVNMSDQQSLIVFMQRGIHMHRRRLNQPLICVRTTIKVTFHIMNNMWNATRSINYQVVGLTSTGSMYLIVCILGIVDHLIGNETVQTLAATIDCAWRIKPSQVARKPTPLIRSNTCRVVIRDRRHHILLH